MPPNEPIKGRLFDETTGAPLSKLRVEAFARDGDDGEKALGKATATEDGSFTLKLRKSPEVAEGKEDVFFRVFRDDELVADTRESARWDPRRGDAPVLIPVPAPPLRPAKPVVERLRAGGQVTTAEGVGVAGLRVEAWDHTVDGPRLVGAGATDDNGGYTIVYDPAVLGDKAGADLEVRVVDPNRDNAEVARTPIIYGVGDGATANVVVDLKDVARSSEYDRLLSAVTPVLEGKALKDVPAEGLAYAANRSGWDARLVAMAAHAAQLSESSGIPVEHAYALLRTGAAPDGAAVARVSDEVVAKSIELAREQGVIADAHSVDGTVARHREGAVAALQSATAAGAVSSLGELVDLRLDGQQKTAFIEAYRATAGDPERLWTAAAEAGVGEQAITALRLDAKLGELTLHNAPLIARLTGDGVADVRDVVDKGLYKAEAWDGLIGDSVPPGVSREDYAAGLAAHVELTFPTLVTADLVRKNEVAVGAEGDRAEVAGFLQRTGDLPVDGQADGVRRLGEQPVRTWPGFDDLSTEAKSTALAVERIYNISPSSGAMTVLAAKGFTNAKDVARVPGEWFVEQHGGDFKTTAEARLVHARAQDVHGGTLNIAASAVSWYATPPVYAIFGGLEKAFGEYLPDTPAKATLETLFRNLDYCACDHCQSVLSPAAYLVELLEMIDVAGAGGRQNPQTVLRGRRPDIEHILLTCENTNVVLPYVDIVNEILEHYIVNPGGLGDYEGHNVDPDAVSLDLLADPQFVLDAAYVETKQKVHPHPLPFDYAVEALRLLFQVWDTTLADGLRVYADLASSRREVLGLNPAELRILTDVGFHALPEYFGEPAGAGIDQLNDAVANGKVFCRRMGISYEELDAVLKTRFVNPGVVDVLLLGRLRRSLVELQSFFTGATSAADLQAALPSDVDPADYDGDVGAWLTARQDLIMGLITLTDTEPGTQCDFAKVELRFALPDPAANRLTTFAYHRLHRFIRLWKKLGWGIELTDQVVVTFLGMAVEDLDEAGLDAAFTALLARIANFKRLLALAGASAKKTGDWLAVFEPGAAAEVRRARLGALLRIGATDLDNLVAISGVDPAADDMDADEPSALAFVQRWLLLKAAGVKVSDVDFLLRHSDATGKLTPTTAALNAQVKAVRDALTAVDAGLGQAVERHDVDFARAQMALVYDTAVVDRFFGLIGRTQVYENAFNTPEEALPDKIVEADERVAFEPFAKTLRYLGVLTDAAQAALDAAADSVALADLVTAENAAERDAFVNGFKAATAALHQQGVDDLALWAAEYPELQAVYDATVAIADPEERASQLVALLLPELQGRLKARAVRAALTSLLGADPLVVDTLTEGPATLHASANPAAGVLSDLLALEDAAVLNADGSYALVVDPPATDDYILYVGAPPNTSATLTVDGAVVIPAGAVGPRGEVETAVPVRLKAGVLTPVVLDIAALPANGRAVLRWRTKGLAKSDVPASRVTLDARAAATRASLMRLRKASLLQGALGLTPRELHHLAAANADTAGVLNALAAAGGVAAADVHAAWAKLAWVLWFVQVRRERESDADTLVAVLEDPALTTALGAPVLPAVMGWKAQDLADALAHFGLAVADLSALHSLRKVADAVDFATAAMQPAADLAAWARPEPDPALIETVKAKLKAALTTAAWQETMRSVNDPLRNLRRDALVACILAFKPPTPAIQTADHLYEHFLIDVQMDACMETSRIRAALSSVQLFIMRCLMNLEDDVSPASISPHWEWMRRYRLWEANRKVFLYPENWLEPELRDNKSPFFKELEAELLKGDITDEAAEDAFFSYLKKLDEVAYLEVVGCYLQQRQPGEPDDDILHVFGRTMGSTRTYYYRRYDGDWTPWEKVPLNIQGDNLFPIMWKNQLFLFWATSSVKPAGAAAETPEQMGGKVWTGNAKVNAEITLEWGELYKGKWTSPKSTEMKVPLRMDGLSSFDAASLVIAGRTEKPSPDMSERLILSVLYLGGDFRHQRVTFTSKRSRPMLEDANDGPLVSDVEWFNAMLLWSPHFANGALEANSLHVGGRSFDVAIQQPANAASSTVAETIFTKTDRLLPGLRVRPLMHKVENQWEAPLFYSDERSVFFVSADEHVRSWIDFDSYFVPEVVGPSIDKLKIPDLYERPPLIKDPLGPVAHGEVVNPVRDPVFDPVFANTVRPVATHVVASETPFVFDGRAFDARGLVGGGV